jgi:hypothetical protein
MRFIGHPTVIAAAGNKPKQIQEFAGRVNSGHASVSVARMVSPEGWVEPGQRPAKSGWQNMRLSVHLKYQRIAERS